MGRNPNVTPPPSPENDRQNEEANVQPLVNMVEKMPEVNNAWLILYGHTIFVGVDLEDNLGTNRVNSIKEEIATKIKQAEHNVNNDIRNVIVTADPNIVSRIERVAVGIANGRPISSFANEITEITQRLTPLNR